MIIKSLSEKYNSNNPIAIKNAEYFYISRERKLLPGYNFFPYYFFRINGELHIHDFEIKNVIDRIIENKIKLNDECIDLLNNNNFNTIYQDKVLLIKFVQNNAGHSLGNILNTIYHFKQLALSDENDYKIIVTEDLINFSTFLMSVIELFFDKSHIIIINDTTLVKFNKSFIIKDFSYKQTNTTNMLIEKLKQETINTNTHTYNNICLIKSEITKNQNSLNKTFNYDYTSYFENKNFPIIMPEQHDVSTLFNIIYNAKNVILSWGCCSYLNSIFVNPTANILVLCHKGYEKEYTEVRDNYPCGILDSGWFPEIANKKLVEYDLPSDINNEVITKLNSTITELLQ